MGKDKWIKGWFGRIWALLRIHRTLPLLWSLLWDNRVPLARKLLFLALGIGYTVLPIDVLVDWVPFIGHLDDVTVWLILVEKFISGVAPNIKSKYLKP